MGCFPSKPFKGKGLFTQQQEFLENNNQIPINHQNAPFTSPPAFSTPSRHSPPASRPSSQHLPLLEGMESLSEVWSMTKQWDKFKQYLATLQEDVDSDGQPLTMVRYAIFLELYATLDKVYNEGAANGRLVEMVDEIAHHEEEFFGRERFLRCLDSGTRKEILRRIKEVKSGNEKAGPMVFIIIFPKIVDKLSEQLGNYQNMVLEKEEVKRSKSKGSNNKRGKIT